MQRVALKFAAREIRRQHSSPFFLRSRHISEKEAAAAAPHHARKLPPPSLPPSLPHGLASPQSEIPSPFAGFQPRAPFLLFAFIWEGRGSLWSEVEKVCSKFNSGRSKSFPPTSERASEIPDGGIAAAKAAAIIRGKERRWKGGGRHLHSPFPSLLPSQLDDSQNANFAVYLLTDSLPLLADRQGLS